MGFLYLGAAVALNSAANILLKLSSESPVGFGNYKLFIALVCFVANVGLYFMALRSVPLSVGYPVMVACTFLLVTGYANMFLSERITMVNTLGYALVIGGIVLVTMKL